MQPLSRNLLQVNLWISNVSAACESSWARTVHRFGLALDWGSLANPSASKRDLVPGIRHRSGPVGNPQTKLILDCFREMSGSAVTCALRDSLRRPGSHTTT
jgi:hypothetical protein